MSTRIPTAFQLHTAVYTKNEISRGLDFFMQIEEKLVEYDGGGEM
jgi:hypothetical protein